MFIITDFSVLRTLEIVPPSLFRTIVLHTQGCLCLWMHLYLPLIAQGIDLVRELRHILVGHDALALRNQCQ